MHRRSFQKLALALALPAPLALAALGGRSAGITLAQSTGPTATPSLAPTPECDDDDLAATLPQTAGPFYTPESPERRSLLEPEMPGTRLVVGGYVYNTDCQPIPGALLDFWQADDAGVYDNQGYRLRGHQFADEDGGFTLETIVPGLYPGRTRHIHVMAQAQNEPVLTTQLYFPDEPANAADGIFDPALVMDVQDADDGKVAFFTFVLPV
ncbi:MAG: intradiol ring-cleavage dioxygenase [Chloroflexi bacterium]|nr:intradiol ring-cleavage dioxygenase [Chloroflexota bacterium]